MRFQKQLKKLIGWLSLIGGILIILWTLYSSYNIFTAKVPAPEIFTPKEETTFLPKSESSDTDELMREMMQEQFKEIMPPDTLPQLLNLVSWSIFAGILIFGGAQTAGVGIKLVRR